MAINARSGAGFGIGANLVRISSVNILKYQNSKQFFCIIYDLQKN
jgi:hypothetical protein